MSSECLVINRLSSMLIDVSTMTSANSFDLVTVGHFAIDTISSPKLIPERTALGGSATYVSLAAARLGAKVSVISKCGKGFPNQYLDWLRSNQVDLSGIKRIESGVTTRFALRYQREHKRRLQLKALAPAITTNDIPNTLQAQAIHVAPIANEVSISVVRKLGKLAPLLSLDPQGFVRDFNANGNVRPKRLKTEPILELIDVYKSSQDEMRRITGIANLRQAAREIHDHGVKIVIVTRGLRGSTLLFEGVFYNVAACKPQVVLDPTGAGDAYIGAFLAEYLRGEDPYWCACVGSAAASFVVEGVGPERFGNKEETYARARIIYQKRE